MSTWPKLVLVMAIAVACTLPARAGEVVDRIVAVVNGKVLLQSDWELEVGYESLMAGQSPENVTATEREDVLTRLEDQFLIQQEIDKTNFRRATPEQIESRIQQIRKQVPDTQTDANWNAVLQRYGMTAEDLAERVGAQLDILRFVDVRFRPSAHVDAAGIRNYYDQTLAPQLKQAGAPVPPLSDVAAKIQEILTQQQVDDLLGAWVKTLRSQGEIRRISTASEVAEQGTQAP